ncbi:OmpH family outer membrane protein [Kordia sp. YSTF-M3]|jgi:outer membrane protein|uniref:OmpH family outer membrane protein n=1 Tax=Kordia aestuariivivens TaxID=2759037 RepID=A0ABR7Q9Y7_9FLAO|nr:OmpH family outer membrane protein [Kordia aestuariivivens]MBC8755382.1 OmpH family outer membrane protein [Kordia aestuariivivens]
MKKLIALGIVALALYSCQQSAKTAFVDNSELVNEYQEKKDLEVKLQAKIGIYQKRKDSITRAFQLEAQDFQSKADKMKPADAQKRYDQLGQKQQMLQQQFQIEENAISKESQTLNDSLLNKVKDFVSEYGKTNNYDYIFGKNEYVGTVYYGKEESNITKVVLEKLNEKYAAEKK